MQKKQSYSEKPLKNEGIRTDMYFSEHKLQVEIDEKGHIDRKKNEENERQMKIQEHLDCRFHRISPDAENFDIFVEISTIQNYMTKSTKQLTKK